MLLVAEMLLAKYRRNREFRSKHLCLWVRPSKWFDLLLIHCRPNVSIQRRVVWCASYTALFLVICSFLYHFIL